MKDGMRNETSSSPARLVEQKSLLGGTDVFRARRPGDSRRARRLLVEEQKLGFAKALMLVVENGRLQKPALPPQTFCPRCGHRGPTEQDFGSRVIRGQRRPQSWCRACRARHLENPASNLPRVQQGDFAFAF